jgi:hypothetical protein
VTPVKGSAYGGPITPTRPPAPDGRPSGLQDHRCHPRQHEPERATSCLGFTQIVRSLDLITDEQSAAECAPASPPLRPIRP